jgi:putative hydrolase of the HAD superfamily
VRESRADVRQVRAILFDAGGTLIHVDGERVCRAAGVAWDAGCFRTAEANAVAAVRRLVLDKPESRDAERLPLYLSEMLSGLGIADPGARREAAVRVAAEHKRANLWSRAADGAPETLEALRVRGYRLACISNADGRVRALLETAGLSPWLEFVVDSFEAGVEKPDPRIFHAATDRLGIAPASCAYVGDIYEIDVVGAEGAGLAPVLIGDGPAPEGVRRVPDLPALLGIFPGFA